MIKPKEKTVYVAPDFKSDTWLNNINPDIYTTRNDTNFNAYTLSRKVNDIYFDTPAETIWQPDVYQFARKVADDANITSVIDIGCGNGDKLVEAFDHKKYKLTGMDYAGSLEIARDRHPAYIWTEANFTDAHSIQSTFTPLHKNTPSLFIMADVIEHLTDPQLLLREVRKILKLNPKNRLILSTPDAEKGKSFDSQTLLPKNEAHIREWNIDRLATFMLSSGFTINAAGHTRSNLQDTTLDTSLLVLSASEDAHRKILSSYALPTPKSSLIITTEHADTRATGGIGSYIKEVEEVCGPNKPIVLICGTVPFTSMMTTSSKAENIVDIFDLLINPATTEHTTEWNSSSICVYHATKNLLYLYDQINMIEYQEYLGVGARLSQAKKVGDIPADVTLVVRGHGSQVYTDRASYDWSGMEKADVFELERISVNFADKLSFPTRYLKDLYTSTGYIFDENDSYIQRLPYQYPDVKEPVTVKPISRLAFLGKRSIMKGYPDFCYLVDTLTDPKSGHYQSNIKHVSVIGAQAEGCEILDEELTKKLTARRISLEIGPIPRHEVLKKINSYAKDSIFCLPYGADNHPVSVLEMIAYYCPFVAYSSGGIPELIPQEFHNNFLSFPDKIELVKKVSTMINTPVTERHKHTINLHTEATSEQKAINASIVDFYHSPTFKNASNKANIPPSLNSLGDLVTVMVPTYNTDLNYIQELIHSLNRQSIKPKEVLFINDASPKENYRKELAALLKKLLNLDYRIIDHEVNLGLAGARNTGLAYCSTKYLANADSDDVLSNDFLYDYVTFLERNPNFAAISSALEAFSDSDQWNTKPNEKKYSYVGVGNCFALGITKNIFGHAGACVVTDVARSIGGWDASDRSKWEDWAFFLKLASRGENIFNFPKVNYYYRVSPGSMARTYAEYPAQMRIARNISGINIWESHRLYAIINDDAKHITEDSAELNKLSVKIAIKIANKINQYPKVKNASKKIIKGSWYVYKKIRR